MTTRRCATLLAVLAALAARPLCAQRPLTVQGIRDLTFGALLPGVPGVVLRTDPVNSGRFDLTGRRLAPVQIAFTLPTGLNGPAGAILPVSFGANDGGFSWVPAAGGQIGFDPNQLFVTVLSFTGRGTVFLGGTASPAPSQRAGAYTGTVTLTVAYTSL